VQVKTSGQGNSGRMVFSFSLDRIKIEVFFEGHFRKGKNARAVSKFT